MPAYRSDSEKTKNKATSFRLKKWLDYIFESEMRTFKLKSKSKALHHLFQRQNTTIETLKAEIEKYRQMLMIENASSTELSNQPKTDCIYYLHPNQCLKDWLKKGIIRKIPDNFCKLCKILLQEQKQLNKIKKAKPIKRKNSQTSTLYKKPAKIFCAGLGEYIDPLKNQAMCQLCKLNTFKVWAECKQKQLSKA